MGKKIVGALIGLGLLFLIAQWWDGQRTAEWEGRVKLAIGEALKQYEAESKARSDSIRVLADSAKLFRDSVKVLELLPTRLKIVTRTVREGFPTDTTARDSLRRAITVIGLQDSTIQALDSVVSLQRRQIGVLEGSGILWATQRAADSTRIAELTGLLEDRPSAKFLGFIPRPKCGPGGGLVTNGKEFLAGVTLACILPL
jgi:hypothetical protein